MKQALPIRHSKLEVSTAPHTLARKRLTSKLLAITQKKMALVVAGAGYGKTTLAAQCIAGLKVPFIWYGLDESDGDIATFLAYLVEGIRRHHPDFAVGMAPRWFESLLSAAHREMVLAEFLAEVERCVTHALVIVLDDYHLVNINSHVHEALGVILNRSAPVLHVVVVSRHEPPLSISRLRAMLEVVEVGEDDLAFEVEEIARLYQDHLKTTVSQQEIATLHEATGGWATGLVLFHHAARGQTGSTPYGNLLAVGNTRDFIFSYLKENIFEHLDPDHRQFMVKAAILDRLAPDLCDTVFNRRNSRQILQMLCRNHLLTFKNEDEKAPFRFHHLLQEFLRDRLKENYSREEIRKIHIDAGRAMEKTGDLPGAMHHYLQGHQFNDLCRLADKMMTQDILEGSFSYMAKILGNIPDDLLRKKPRLVYFRAKLASVQGNPRLAIDGLKQALAQFRVQKDATGISNCLKDLGFHYYITGDIRLARKQMALLWGRPHSDPFFPIEVAGFLILFCAILGDFDAADDYHGKAYRFTAGSAPEQKALAECWLNLCQSYRLHCAGAFGHAYRLNAKALDGFRDSGIIAPLPLAYFQAALFSFYRGDQKAGGGYAEQGLHVARQVGFNDSTYAWLLYSRALNTLAEDSAQRSLEDANQALYMFSSHDNFWGQASVYELLAMIHQAKNQPAQAESALRQGLAVIAGRGIVITRAALTLRLAQLYLDRADHTAARSLIGNHGDRFAVSLFHQFLWHRLKAQIAATQERTGPAVGHMAEALRIAQKNGFEAWILQGSVPVIQILAACHGAAIMKPYIESLLADADEVTSQQFASHAMQGKASPGHMAQSKAKDLDIHCLGPFKVFRGDCEIPAKAWRSANVRRLFQYLVIKNRQGFIPKDVFLELLWPGEDPQKTSRRFHVTLTMLRKTLEPELKRGVPSCYLLRQNDAYRLEPGQNGRIDFVDFLKQCRHLKQHPHSSHRDRLDALLHVAALYHGPLFQEEPYIDWFASDRDLIQSQYLELLTAIIRAYEERKDWPACISWVEKYLTIDRYAEPVHRVLMRCHFHLGDTARLKSAFQRCRHQITADLDCPLNPKTTALYRELIAMTQN